MRMVRPTTMRSRQIKICLRLLLSSIRMQLLLAILSMQSLLGDYVGTMGRRSKLNGTRAAAKVYDAGLMKPESYRIDYITGNKCRIEIHLYSSEAMSVSELAEANSLTTWLINQYTDCDGLLH